MNPFEYIKEQLKSFVNDFSNTRVRYEFDSTIETHFIEIVPNEVYHLDQKYLQWESEMFDRFIQLYPDQNICFISDDAIVGLDRVEFELVGEKFALEYSSSEDAITVNNSQIIVSSCVNDEMPLTITTIPTILCTNGFVCSNPGENQFLETLECAQDSNLPIAA
ncbi:MAG: hypothetical protein P4L28_12015 [Paludibacteraceae bacterium]|nr:hypothetical protein [Paludibacteraceae bacterium]